MDIPLMVDLDPLDEPFNQLCRQHMVLILKVEQRIMFFLRMIHIQSCVMR